MAKRLGIKAVSASWLLSAYKEAVGRSPTKKTGCFELKLFNSIWFFDWLGVDGQYFGF